MKVILSADILRQLKKMDRYIAKAVFEYLEDLEKLDNPKSKGKPLVANLKGLWRYRVGDMRVICRIKDNEIEALKVGARKDVYD